MTTSSSVGDSLAIRTTLPIIQSSKGCRCCLKVCAGVYPDPGRQSLDGTPQRGKELPPLGGHDSGGAVKHGKNRTKNFTKYF